MCNSLNVGECGNVQHSASALTAYMRCSQPPETLQSPDLFSSESYEWEAIQNLDQFFVRVYRLACMHITA